MIRRHGTFLRTLLALIDAGAALFLIGVISALRFGPNWRDFWGQVFNDPWAPAVLLSGGWVLVLWSQGLYRLRARWSFRAQVTSVLKSLAVMVLVTFAVLFVFKLPDVSRLFLFTLLPAMALVSLILRAAIHAYLTSLRVEGRNSRFVLVVGSGAGAVRYVHELQAQTTLGLTVVGYLDGSENAANMGVPHLGGYDNLAVILHERVIDEVAICMELAEWERLNELTAVCRAEGKIVRIPIAGSLLDESHAYVENLAGIPVLSLLDGPDRQFGLAIKRIVDIVASALGMLLGSPIFLAVSVAIVLKDGRPIFFRQQRVGLHGRRVRLIKFRTMVTDAEARLEGLRAQNELKGHVFKITNDPRVTSVGRFLRRTSLDELPQLWNVFRGDMSLVGPRPPLPNEVNAYDPWHRRRLAMKPGITGLWQISARREQNFDRWVQMDLEYIDRWSLTLDTKIALKTLPAMLRAEGR